jgi:hypothetical protein
MKVVAGPASAGGAFFEAGTIKLEPPNIGSVGLTLISR